MILPLGTGCLEIQISENSLENKFDVPFPGPHFVFKSLQIFFCIHVSVLRGSVVPSQSFMFVYRQAAQTVFIKTQRNYTALLRGHCLRHAYTAPLPRKNKTLIILPSLNCRVTKLLTNLAVFVPKIHQLKQADKTLVTTSSTQFCKGCESRQPVREDNFSSFLVLRHELVGKGKTNTWLAKPS